PVEEAVAQSLAALDWLKRQGARQIFFKYCSTFDSTPKGNIGPVADALMEKLGAKFAIVCPAFPGAGRTIYLGPLFVGGESSAYADDRLVAGPPDGGTVEQKSRRRPLHRGRCRP